MIRIAVLLAASLAYSQDHHADVNAHGDHVMGFSHEKTTHHFRLSTGGGVIEVTANDAKDTESRDQIRMHLGHIAKMFASGDFHAPMLIHDQVPPGTEVMTRLKSEIVYVYEKIDHGARVRMSTRNPEALDAIHDFLRFQIADHQTGDPLK